MRAVLGALSGLAGAAVGFVVTALLAAAFAKVTNASTREGAVGYLVIAVGVFGAIGGTVVGILLFARRAPAGEGARFAGTAVLGLVALAALVVLGVWAWASSREVPAKYGNTLASLELEFRVKKGDVPDGPPSRWLAVEVQTATTRPEGVVLADKVREEGDWLVVPVIQNPLYRSSNRSIVARVSDRHVELFTPPWKAKPDPRAAWSDWHAPRHVEPAREEPTPGPAPRPILEVRYRVRLYGE